MQWTSGRNLHDAVARRLLTHSDHFAVAHRSRISAVRCKSKDEIVEAESSPSLADQCHRVILPDCCGITALRLRSLRLGRVRAASAALLAASYGCPVCACMPIEVFALRSAASPSVNSTAARIYSMCVPECVCLRACACANARDSVVPFNVFRIRHREHCTRTGGLLLNQS